MRQAAAAAAQQDVVVAVWQVSQMKLLSLLSCSFC
jgi:hypothetical protein